MHNISKWKILVSILVTIIAIICASPNFISTNLSIVPNTRINLGLDLRGGAHLLLDVDFDSYLSDLSETLANNVRKYLRDDKMGYKNLTAKKNSVEFVLRNEDDFSRIQKLIKKIDNELNVTYVDGLVKLSYTDSKLLDLQQKVIDQSIEIIRMRVDSKGTTEPVIQRQGDKHILLQVPGEQDPEHLRNILGKTAKLTFHIVDETADISQALKGHIQAGSILVRGEYESSEEYHLVLKKSPIVTGDQLTNAQASFNQNSQPVVLFSFDSIGSKAFAEATKQNQGKRLAIVLDNKLLSAPVVNEPILGGSGIISGNFTVESANDLALLLRAGALPAPLKIIEERSIGPTLGADSINSGQKAALVGFTYVVIFMMWSYGILGIFANIALSLALLYILALLSIFGATLTLPGIAGIILTIGMAVDANVLIYERIREELAKGASNLYSVKVGFETAFGTIADSNITTLVVAFLLYIFGVGAIKGFAVTLAIGIVSSMFSAIVITKLLIDLWVRYYKPKTLGL